MAGIMGSASGLTAIVLPNGQQVTSRASTAPIKFLQFY
ncbi:hypothetical protein X971_5105 (plasmid) [Agrobacterium tumefaciens LBA4213 (Ach5)]|nr:hypothetical protein X971_5105 [Agrobacterium tumefaciens LBA4213 (Ach5)]